MASEQLPNLPPLPPLPSEEYIQARLTHRKILNRLNACQFTLNSCVKDLLDPQDQDLRADLLIAIDEVLNTAHTLYANVSELVWNELDSSAHPSRSPEYYSDEELEMLADEYDEDETDEDY